MNRSVSHLRAIGFALAGFTFWVLSDSCIKFVSDAHLPPYEIVGILGLSAAILLFAKSAWRSEVKSLWPQNPRRQFAQAGLSLAGFFSTVIGLGHLPLTIFYVMIFMAPMIIPVLSSIFLHERLDVKRSIAIVTGFVGVIVAVHPGSAHRSGDWIGYVALTFTACVFAVNAVWLRRLTQQEKVNSINFFNALCEALVGGTLTLWQAVPVGFTFLTVLVIAGALGLAGSTFYALASKHTTASNIAPFHYTQLITGAVVGYILWNEVPTLYLMIGTVMIIGSGLYIASLAHMTEMPPDRILSP